MAIDPSTPQFPTQAALEQWILGPGLEAFQCGAGLEQVTRKRLAELRHGDLHRWAEAVAALLPKTELSVCLSQAQVAFGAPLSGQAEREELRSRLMGLAPWKKGPFVHQGVLIDAEWRSDLKWERLAPHVNLAGVRLLDVGCGNGYALFRALGAGARSAVGIDPSLLFVLQFAALKQSSPRLSAWVLPLRLEDVGGIAQGFDLTLSMGVLYHRKSPLEHLGALRSTLRPGGELVVETLVVEGGEGHSLLPPGRYAAMPNVWFIPSVATLFSWLRRCGFEDVRLLDVTVTTETEQRATPWTNGPSLREFLDAEDPSRTVEGHPAPRRAVLSARRP